MSRKFRLWVTLLMAPVAAVLALVALGLADQDGQATLVFGIWGLILLGAACLLVLGVQRPLPWRLLGAVVFAGVVAYFASGYDSELSGPQRNTYGGSVVLAGVVGAYFAITGRFPHKVVTGGRAGNDKTEEGQMTTEGKGDM
jgi:hypothetical protein